MPTFNSTNSSGASCNTDNKHAFRSMTGRWIVPNIITFNDGVNYNLVTWIGLAQGVVDADFGIIADVIFQVGIMYDSSEINPFGFPGYKPFFLSPRDYSYNPVLNFEVSAGDAIFAMICNTGPQIFFSLANETTNQYTSWAYQLKGNLGFIANWAGWVVGKKNADAGNSVIAKYGAVVFDETSADINGNNIFPANGFSLNDFDSGGVFGTLSRGRIEDIGIVVCDYGI